MLTAKEISRQLAQQAENVSCYLFPRGKKQGNEWRIGSINGNEGQSLAIHLSGEKAGIWCDFASVGKEGCGDLLDLWAAKYKISLSQAMKEAAQYLGMPQPKFAAYKPPIFAKPEMKNTGKVSLSSPVGNYLINERKLASETISAFRMGEKGRTIVFPYWRDDELVFVKYLGLDRIAGKKQISVEANCEPCLFGWHLIPPNVRSITICEGEIDAMSLFQYGLPALSVPFGGGVGNKHKWLEYEFDRLAIFDEIYLCFDSDPEGKAAVAELVERLGRHRCRIVELPYKDANACVQANISKEEMQRCFANAYSLDPDELKSAHVYVEQVIDTFYPSNDVQVGYDLPWKKAKNKILFRPDELSVWTGINGHGKSQFLGQVILHSMQQGARVCIASLELKPRRLLTRLTRQATGLAQPSEEYIRAIHEWYNSRLWLFDLVGTAKAKRLLEVFLYARQRYGIDIFVIDSLMKLDIAEDDYKGQKLFIEQLCDFKNQHNCHVHLIAHPRKGADENLAPGKLDNKGTGAISDLADNCFSIWRNIKEKRKSIKYNRMARN